MSRGVQEHMAVGIDARRTIMGRMRDLTTRMQDFEDEQFRLISGLSLHEPSSRRTPTYSNSTLPVSNLRSAMSEVTEQLESQHQTLQEMVNETRRFRETATSVLDQPRLDLAPPRQEVAISTARQSAHGVMNELTARKAREARASALRKHTLQTTPVGEDGEALTCAICLDILCINQEVASLPCVHTFHASCMTQWAQKQGGLQAASCPLCKLPVLQPPARDTPTSSAFPFLLFSSSPPARPSTQHEPAGRAMAPAPGSRLLGHGDFGFASWREDVERAAQPQAEMLRVGARLWGGGRQAPPVRPSIDAARVEEGSDARQDARQREREVRVEGGGRRVEGGGHGVEGGGHGVEGGGRGVEGGGHGGVRGAVTERAPQRMEGSGRGGERLASAAGRAESSAAQGGLVGGGRPGSDQRGRGGREEPQAARRSSAHVRAEEERDSRRLRAREGAGSREGGGGVDGAAERRLGRGSRPASAPRARAQPGSFGTAREEAGGGWGGGRWRGAKARGS